MCGITGIINGGETIAQDIGTMCDALIHRGPDDAGFVIDGDIALGHRRLSIIDLTGGVQPMYSDDGELSVVFNGEIYNFPGLRRELEGFGHRFVTDSDTEVLLHGFRQWGEAMVDRLNGMFAFALFVRSTRRVLIARDHLGIKPLFIATIGRTIVIASELGAITAVPAFREHLTVNPTALMHYMALFYVPDPLTIYNEVRRLPPAHLAWIDAGRVSTHRYWRIPSRPGQATLTYPEAVDELGRLLKTSVKRQMMADVPLGAFLSGGVDSSAVVAQMAALGVTPQTFTVGFSESDHDERGYAREVATYLGTAHHELLASYDHATLVDDLIFRFGEPFADSSALPTYLVSRATREHVTVALSGDGGDELFAGYPRYDTPHTRAWLDRLPTGLRKHGFGLAARCLPDGLRGVNWLRGAALDNERYALLEIGEFRARQLLSRQVRRQTTSADTWGFIQAMGELPSGLDSQARMQWIDTHSYLPGDILTKVDRMSMAVSLETRVPLLDKDIVTFAFSLPTNYKWREGRRKAILKDVLARAIPERMIDRPKMGFGVPIASWFRGPLRELLQDELSATSLRESGILNVHTTRRLLSEHLSGHRDTHWRLWQLFVLNRWWRRVRPTLGGGR